MAITVREAQECDIDVLVGMNRIVHDLHVVAEPTFFRHADPAAVAELFRSRLAQPECRAWIACVAQDPAGYAVSVLRERPENAIGMAQRWYEIEELAVSPAHRRRGVAHALVERMLAEAQVQDVRDVHLTCWSFNAEARAAFEAMGFRPMTVRFCRESG